MAFVRRVIKRLTYLLTLSSALAWRHTSSNGAIHKTFVVPAKWHRYFGHVNRFTYLLLTYQHPVFLQAGCHSCCPTNSVKALKGHLTYANVWSVLQCAIKSNILWSLWQENRWTGRINHYHHHQHGNHAHRISRESIADTYYHL